VSIDGAASGLGVYGAVDDGLSGRGSIAVSDGGHLIITHGPTVDGLVLGGSSSGTGNLSVANGGQVSVLGYSVIGGAGSGSLTISGGSSFTESAQVGTIYSTFPTVGFPPPPAGLNAAMTLGLTSTGTGSAVISDASTYVPISGGLVVGEAGSGSLSVTNVAILVVSGTIGQAGNIILGDAKGSTGTLSVSAQAQVIDNGAISVGYFGHGELDVSNATLTIDTPNSGALLISAGPLENQVVASGVVNVAGGLIDDVHGSGVIVGESGSATLAISEAGSIGGTVLTGSLAIGENFSTGLVTVDGAASGVGAVTGTSIGDGTLALTNGGRLVTGDSPAGYGLNIHGGAAQLSMAGGAVANVLGQSQISGGALSITGGSGFTGAVDGSAFAQDALSLQAQGDATIGGPGSYLNLTGALAVGDGDGYGSASSMVVENGGLVSVTAAGESDAGVSIGNDPTTDTLVVDGSGSRLIDTGVFAVGGSAAVGNASLTISAGGTVMVAEASGQTGPAAMIGDPDAQAGAGSVATVTGTGSDWTISGTPDRWKPDRHSQAGCSRWRAGECRPGVAERCL
jgi:T5SS/PEP-CTERM-associated repeat protein